MDHAPIQPSQPARLNGLSSAVAAERLAQDGPNVLDADRPRSLWKLAADALREPMLLLLLAATLIYFVLGDVREAVTLSVAVIGVVSISIVQAGRTERVLSALRQLASPRAQVLRDQQVVSLPASELVRGDIIRIAEGDRVPADGVLRTGTALMADESLLSGESVPLVKTPDREARLASLHTEGASHSLFSGTLIVSGRGTAEIHATGARTELGKIGSALREIEPSDTPLQREVRWLVRRMAIVGAAVAAAIVVAGGLATRHWVEALLSGITAAMSLLPEEFPVVLSVFLALGARRLAKQQVLARHSSAIEILGAVRWLCADKTGTLTQNRMSIRQLRTAHTDLSIGEALPNVLPESVHELVEAGILACPRDPFDPMEQAFHELGSRSLSNTEHLHPDWSDVREYPLTPELLAVTHVWRAPNTPALVVATKGAPEAVFDLCHLAEPELSVWRAHVSELAGTGLRVLGIARSRQLLETSPAHPHDVTFDMIGLVGLMDPLRVGVREAISQCRTASIHVLMITGDHPATATAVAREAGIGPGRTLIGSEIEAMDEAELASRLVDVSIVARAQPAHKLRIVRAFKRGDGVVAMTGDGINDAPALKAADVGIAMGARGTEVAREAAALVLTNDDFGAIVGAIRLGRRIHDNLVKAFHYIVAVHLPVAGFALVPALSGWSALLLPAHVVFLEMIIDPACSVVFELEPEEPDILSRPPGNPKARLFTRASLGLCLAQGLAAWSLPFYLVAQARAAGLPLGTQRTLAFGALVAGNLALLIVNRSARDPFFRTWQRWNRAAALLVALALGACTLMVAVPVVRTAMSLTAAPLPELLSVLAAAVAPVLLLDLVKLRLPRHSTPAQEQSSDAARRN